MLHLFKYRFLQTFRSYGIMFWALAFPLILGTLFYLSFGNAGLKGTGDSDWDSIPVAVITESSIFKSSETAQNTHTNADTFAQFLKELDGDMLDIQDISSEKAAIKALREEEILGIYYAKETPSLTVGKSDINESILTSLLNTYNQNAAMFQDIAVNHPERLMDAVNAINDYDTMIEEQALNGQTLNPNVTYFFTLIAYACLSGAFLGVQNSLTNQANLSALGARRSVTPTHKLMLITVDMLVLILIHFFDILILNLYIVKVLGVNLGNNIPALLLVDLMGSVIGISIGVAFGCVSKLSASMKTGLTVALTLFPSFLAGLMFGNMKYIIEQHCPIINRINPAAVLSDAFYCLGVYNDTARFNRCMIILAVMSALCLLIAFLAIRRERYDSI